LLWAFKVYSFSDGHGEVASGVKIYLRQEGRFGRGMTANPFRRDRGSEGGFRGLFGGRPAALTVPLAGPFQRKDRASRLL
jgi:hypothetical protein